MSHRFDCVTNLLSLEATSNCFVRFRPSNIVFPILTSLNPVIWTWKRTCENMPTHLSLHLRAWNRSSTEPFSNLASQNEYEPAKRIKNERILSHKTQNFYQVVKIWQMDAPIACSKEIVINSNLDFAKSKWNKRQDIKTCVPWCQKQYRPHS